MRSLSHSRATSKAIGAALLASVLGGCVAPDGATGRGDFYTTTYLSVEEALAVALPDATTIRRITVQPSREERQAIARKLGGRVREREFSVYCGEKADGSLDGFAVIQEEIGKFKLITFIVAIEPDASARRVAVMVYREARGGEVAQRRFLVQYEGKSAASPLSMNRDIVNITGATMSVNSMNFGVKKVLAAVETLLVEQPDRLREELSEAEVVDVGAALSPTAAKTELKRYRHAQLVMGSLCEMELWGTDRTALKQAAADAFDEVHAVDRALSDYRPESELTRLSRTGRARISSLTAEFLEAARFDVERDRRSFSISLSAQLVDLWREASRKRCRSERGTTGCGAPPRGISALSKLTVHRQLLTHGLKQHGVRLDPGGLGKGFCR